MTEPSPSADSALPRLLAREILLSERRRVLGLAGLLIFIVCAGLLMASAAPGVVRTMFHGRMPVRIAFTAFLPFICYELVVAGVFTVLLRQGRHFWAFGRFANAFIETSFPTLLLYQLSGYGVGALAFNGWHAQLYFLFIILSTLRLDFVLSAFTGAVAAVEFFALAFVTLHRGWLGEDLGVNLAFYLTRSGVLLAAGLIAGAVGVTIRRYFERAIAAASARDRVTNLFGQHVSPEVVERLLALDAPEAGEMRQVCVMFVDIRSFTAAARERSPAEVVSRLDAVFALLVDSIDRHHGIVNKFLGDGLLAIFGAPLDDPAAAADAVTAAREMLRAVASGNAGSTWPIRIGIGIHIGEAVAGTVGSPRRKEYTVIGDTVNLAARLESLNKEVGSQLLVSDAVRRAAGETIGEAQPLGPISVRGYAEPVTVWRLA
ncbi:MAG TPA: adenylate/guanylate cyclase domain-containing protein [Stellaceae bacterium]|nr:adenylate/guanylate cyclase domain-containing protein [Stellaceae bacterium]